MKSPVSASLLCSILALSGTSAYAVSLATEPFALSGALAGQGTGTGWSNTWSGGGFTSTTGLSKTGVGSSGNAVVNTGTGQAFRDLSVTTAITGSVYFSFLMSQTAIGYSNFGIFNGGTELLGFGDTYNGASPSATYSIYRAAAGGTGGYAASTSPIDTSGATHFLVLQIDGTTNNAYLYLDPATGTTAPLTSTAIVTAPVAAGLSFSRIRLEGGNATPNGTVDELRIGTTYADVVPEPTTVSLLAIPALGLLLRRRTRG